MISKQVILSFAVILAIAAFATALPYNRENSAPRGSAQRGSGQRSNSGRGSGKASRVSVLNQGSNQALSALREPLEHNHDVPTHLRSSRNSRRGSRPAFRGPSFKGASSLRESFRIPSRPRASSNRRNSSPRASSKSHSTAIASHPASNKAASASNASNKKAYRKRRNAYNNSGSASKKGSNKSNSNSNSRLNSKSRSSNKSRGSSRKVHVISAGSNKALSALREPLEHNHDVPTHLRSHRNSRRGSRPAFRGPSFKGASSLRESFRLPRRPKASSRKHSAPRGSNRGSNKGSAKKGYRKRRSAAYGAGSGKKQGSGRKNSGHRRNSSRRHSGKRNSRRRNSGHGRGSGKASRVKVLNQGSNKAYNALREPLEHNHDVPTHLRSSRNSRRGSRPAFRGPSFKGASSLRESFRLPRRPKASSRKHSAPRGSNGGSNKRHSAPKGSNGKGY